MRQFIVSRHSRRVVHATLIALLSCGAVVAAAERTTVRATTTEAATAAIRVEPARTWVKVARVDLTLGELTAVGDELVGEFRIHVPFMPSMDDHGTVRIHAPGSLSELVRRGGVLDGTAKSVTGETNPVRCTLAPDGALGISITMPRRTLSFATRYRVIAGAS